jgi:hypothetical protein
MLIKKEKCKMKKDEAKKIVKGALVINKETGDELRVVDFSEDKKADQFTLNIACKGADGNTKIFCHRDLKFTGKMLTCEGETKMDNENKETKTEAEPKSETKAVTQPESEAKTEAEKETQTGHKVETKSDVIKNGRHKMRLDVDSMVVKNTNGVILSKEDFDKEKFTAKKNVNKDCNGNEAEVISENGEFHVKIVGSDEFFAVKASNLNAAKKLWNLSSFSE